MEPSQSSSLDPVIPSSPIDSLGLIREMYGDEDSEELNSSESMNPSHHASPPSSPTTMEPSYSSPAGSVHPSPPMDAAASVRELCQHIDPLDHIDPLVSFVKNHLQKMTTPLEAESSSQEGWIQTVRDSTKLAAGIIKAITEADEISNSDAIRTVENVTSDVMKGVKDLYWVFIGLSVAAYAVENYLSVASTERECRDHLLNILKLAKGVHGHNIRLPYERDELCNAVKTIVEGAIIFCDYLTLKKEKICRFLSAETAAAQLEKANQQVMEVTNSLAIFSLDRHWDVFLSHSGKQKNFARQLHRDITREDVSCFFDEDPNCLPLGERFPLLMLRAAQTCNIAVVVISNEFLRSKWPLIELSAFVSAINSGKNPNLIILPIFFKIDPRILSRIPKDNPEWENLNVSNDTKDKWLYALKEVRPTQGPEFREGGDEVRCRDKIVEKNFRLLRGNKPPKLLEFEPVGIEGQVREVKALLDMEGTLSALAVIVHGFGGVGKSTVAASVVESMDWSSMDVKFCRVAIDEKTPNKTSHVIDLQKHVIHTLGGLKPYFQDHLDGRKKIKEALQKKFSLLYIDNVVDKDYIRLLLPKDLQSADEETKLRIIITSREKTVKAELNIICKEYEVKGLSPADSESLLVDSIVQSQMVESLPVDSIVRSQMDEEDEKRMIYKVAVACRGVPLLLSVFGKHLRQNRTKKSYEEALDSLGKGNLDSYRDEDLSTTLMFVYHKIKDVEVKEVFLDISTYFHGWKWNLVADVVDDRKLEDLRWRGLLSESGSGEVIVHDILRLMGMKEAEQTRFSNYKDFSVFLEDNNLDVLGNVKGIKLDNNRSLTSIKSTQLEAMHKSLRVLILGDWVILDGPPCNKAFRNLRYLSLGDIRVFPFKDPSELKKLRVFQNRSYPGTNLSNLPSSLKHISHEVPDFTDYMYPGVRDMEKFVKLPYEKLSSLKSLSIQRATLPEGVHLPPSLVDLNLMGCKNLSIDISHLTALQSLILDECDLKCMPQGFGKLTKLKSLSMKGCKQLAFLPEEFGKLSSLEMLRMEYCIGLKALPNSFGGLLSLQTLDLTYCGLQLLPESFEKLRITSLKLYYNSYLMELPNNFGNMPLLKYLSLDSCWSLMSLPDSFVQLKMLETLNIRNCRKLSILPKDFDRLRHLKHMTVEDCELLEELPHGFGALPSLKTLTLKECKRFVNLPVELTELTSLEELRLVSLPLKKIPDGFAILQRLRVLFLESCSQLTTSSDDFEYMATLERLSIRSCAKLYWPMEKILNLRNCSMADITGSSCLVESWGQMQSQIEHPFTVITGDEQINREVDKRAIEAALLNGKCVEVDNSSGQLMERSSLLAGLEEGTRATVAFILLPVKMDLDKHQMRQMLERFEEMAREKAKSNGWGMSQIVCATIFVWTREMSTQTEVEEGIRQLLPSMPRGWCALSESVRILADYYSPSYRMLRFFIGHAVVNSEGRRKFENFEAVEQDEISINELFKNKEDEDEDDNTEDEDDDYQGITNLMLSIRDEQSSTVAGQSKTEELVEALKASGIHHLDYAGQQVMVDDLHGKTIGVIICIPNELEIMRVTEIYKDFQKDSNFIVIAIPGDLCNDKGGIGTYTRVIQPIPWATILHPNLYFNDYEYNHFVVLDKEGHIAFRDASSLVLGWGLKFYPFTQDSIRQSLESESWSEILFHGMNIVELKAMKSKMTFLCATMLREGGKKAEQLVTKIRGDFEFLYVGDRDCFGWDYWYRPIGQVKQEYEDATENMRVPSLSVGDQFLFWYRCRYLARKEGRKLYNESHIMMQTLHELAKRLCDRETGRMIVLVDKDGVVTFRGEDVLEMIYRGSFHACWLSISYGYKYKWKWIQSLSRGECSLLPLFVKRCFRDEIHDLPSHPQHRLSLMTERRRDYECGVCGEKHDRILKRSYSCEDCRWFMCGLCWETYAKEEGERLVRARDN